MLLPTTPLANMAIMACQAVATVPACDDSVALESILSSATVTTHSFYMPAALAACSIVQVIMLHNLHKHPVDPIASSRKGICIGSDQYRRERVSSVNTIDRLREWLNGAGEKDGYASSGNRAGYATMSADDEQDDLVCGLC